MSQQVVNVSKETLNKMSSYYQTTGSLPPGAVFKSKKNGCTITGYRSGKVLFQGAGSADEASKWQKNSQPAGASRRKPSVSDHKWKPSAEVLEKPLIGSDETGTGDYFGPMTVVAAHLTPAQLKEAEPLGLRDSKSMNDEIIRSTAPKLLSLCTYSLRVLRNEKYNELQQKGYNQGAMKALLHHRAIQSVIEQLQGEDVPVDGVLIDQFVKPERYFEYVKQTGGSWPEQIPIYFATKAEDMHPAVAAGSILARYAFLKEMDAIAQTLGLPVPKGAGSNVDKAAAEIASVHGKETLFRYVKAHFSNTGRVLK
ncbi:ribonuclease HIII [Alkalicoccus urumqiensis]|uniref:Ribonuclease HIII n=1 Tax=Alkalicoccus urumqiensis TaxID=1548213 RepID=A0A2P6MFD2_ALKUR|nr:ribonuclease HIII [Alkalicoccus urumqiensis]PRO64957.1 ribonuclease HIII [Alkalicoccus urumqiensis]